MSRFSNIDEVVAERNRLERRLARQGMAIRHDYERLKENPFSLEGVGSVLNRVLQLRYILRLFRRK